MRPRNTDGQQRRVRIVIAGTVLCATIVLSLVGLRSYNRSRLLSDILRECKAFGRFNSVTYESAASKTPAAGVRILRPAWLRWIPSRDGVLSPLDQVESIWPVHDPVPAAGIRLATFPSGLSNFPELRYLSLDAWNVTDKDLSIIRRLVNLEVLNVSDSSVTDDGLAHAVALPGLRSVDLSGTSVRFHTQPNPLANSVVDHIWASETLVDDNGLRSLLQISTLKYLDVSKSHITKIPQRDLLPSQINGLDLGYCPLTSAGITTLNAYQSITELSLRGTRIDDSAISVFLDMDALEYVDLSMTDVTASGVVRLSAHKRLKGLEVEGIDLDSATLETLLSDSSLRTLSVAEDVAKRFETLPEAVHKQWRVDSQITITRK